LALHTSFVAPSGVRANPKNYYDYLCGVEGNVGAPTARVETHCCARKVEVDPTSLSGEKLLLELTLVL